MDLERNSLVIQYPSKNGHLFFLFFTLQLYNIFSILFHDSRAGLLFSVDGCWCLVLTYFVKRKLITWSWCWWCCISRPKFAQLKYWGVCNIANLFMVLCNLSNSIAQWLFVNIKEPNLTYQILLLFYFYFCFVILSILADLVIQWYLYNVWKRVYAIICYVC